MQKTFLTAIFFAFILSFTVLFQNCTTKKLGGGSSASKMSIRVDREVVAMEGSSVVLQIPVEYLPRIEGRATCTWHAVNFDNDLTDLNYGGMSYPLENVTSSDEGLYRVNCLFRTGISSMTFRLIVKRERVRDVDPPVDPRPTGTYQGFFVENSQRHQFIETHNILREDASGNCEVNAGHNSNLGIECFWESELIYSRAETSVGPRGVYEYFYIINEQRVSQGRTPGLGRQESLDRCIDTSERNASKIIECFWESELIFYGGPGFE